MAEAPKKLLLIEMNEINFSLVREYIALYPDRFASFTKLMELPNITTHSEAEYHLLEPWIQWPSVHTAMPFDNHEIYRLGDIIHSKKDQIFEIIERLGYSVGVVSAMNADNRLTAGAYFIPDPWTETLTDGSFWAKIIAESVSQAVNDNSRGRITAKSLLQLAFAWLRFHQKKHFWLYVRLFFLSIAKPWNRSIILDLFLHDLHSKLFSAHKPDFSTLFLNAGAHIQHHYLFNSTVVKKSSTCENPDWYVEPDEDPLADLLDVYEKVLGDILSVPEVDLVIATGLSQRPYDRVKFYYRLTDHNAFLKTAGIKFVSVHPRMTRDFLVTFCDEDAALSAQMKLSCIKVLNDDTLLFGEIDNRGTSLFVTLTYPSEVTDKTEIIMGERRYNLSSLVSFVAVKNGMHHGDGFAFFSENVFRFFPKNDNHVASIGRMILNYFECS